MDISGPILVMGVSGCGKSSVGRALATALNLPFLDADDFHPPENVAKMKAGIPLNDDDRSGWLDAIREAVLKIPRRLCVLACSALKKKYRDKLCGDPNHAQDWLGWKIVFLRGSFELIEARMKQRSSHFMPTALLKSQFETLEAPEPTQENTIIIDLRGDKSVEDIISEATNLLH